jgi:hypothetical protein
MGYRITKMALAVIIGSGMAGVAAATGAVPAGAATSTAFAITVDGGTSSSISTSVDATLAESGLPSDATGTVDFTQGVTTLCTATLPATSCTTSGLGAGSYTGITADYSGDATYDPSTSDNSVDLTVTTSTAFAITVDGGTSSSISTSVDATLAESGLPSDATGTVDFTQGRSTLCTATLPATSCTTSGLGGGSYTGITAAYSGDATYYPSTSDNSVDLTVTADTSFTIAVNDSTSAVIPTSADATLSETGLPGPATGTVEFDQGGSILCTATLPDTSCTTSGLPADSYTGITATYSGGGSYSGSTSTNSVDLTVADSTLTCTKVAGFATSVKKVQFAKCGTSQKGAWINGSSYTTGGTATWATSKATFTYAVTTTSPGRGSCPAGRIEQDASGLVLSADANAVVQVGDYVGFSVCENTTTHVVKLLPGTSASL